MDRERALDEIRARLSIVDLVQSYVQLRKAGRSFVGLCPFHSEKSPSFHVSPDKQLYYCFGCGAGGNLFNFYMQMERVSFPEAARELARRAGVELPRSFSNQHKESVRIEMRDVLERALRFYRSQLQAGPSSGLARDYLARRGLSRETIETFEIGWAPPGWSNFARELGERAQEKRLAERCGLTHSGPKGIFDHFRSRIMFPIRDAQGKLCGFGGRIIPPPEAGGVSEVKSASSHEPKYLNSPDSELFRKGDILYGLFQGRGAALKSGNLAVVEGYMDVISLHQAGIAEAVAPLGTALTQQHVRLLKRYTSSPRVIFDPDAAGAKAAHRALGLFLPEGILARAVVLPAGLDPDAFVRKEGAQAMRRLMEVEKDLFDSVLDGILGAHPPISPQNKKAASETILSLLKGVGDPIVLDLYLRRASGRVGVREEALWKSLPAEMRPGPIPASRRSAGGAPSGERPSGTLGRLREKQQGALEESALSAVFEEPELWPALERAKDLFRDPWVLHVIGRWRERSEPARPGILDELLTQVDDAGRLARLTFRSGKGDREAPESLLRGALVALFNLAKEEKLVYVRGLHREAVKQGDDAKMKFLYSRKKALERLEFPWPLDRRIEELWEEAEQPSASNHGEERP